MQVLQLIKIFYAIYSIYSIGVYFMSDYQFAHLLCGLVTIWIVYFLFRVGFNTHWKRYQESVLSYSSDNYFYLFDVCKWSGKWYFFNALFCWVISVIAAKYYTGNGVGEVVNGIMGNISLYNNYQRYFSEANIASFSVEKIPYILMLAYLTLSLFWSMVSIYVDKIVSRKQYFYLSSIVMSYLYFGAARGTNFEVYTVFVLILYCLFLRESNGFESYVSLSLFFKMLLLGLIMVAIFIYTVSQRSTMGVSLGISHFCEDIMCDYDSLFVCYFPSFVSICTKVFGYLGFGVYTIGVALSDIYSSSVSMFIALFIPRGTDVVIEMPFREVLHGYVTMGVRWMPDFLVGVSSFGLFLFLFFVGGMGYFLSVVQNSNVSNVLCNYIGFLLLFEMVSIPVGNFLFTSSSNILAILVGMFLYLFERNKHIA